MFTTNTHVARGYCSMWTYLSLIHVKKHVPLCLWLIYFQLCFTEPIHGFWNYLSYVSSTSINLPQDAYYPMIYLFEDWEVCSYGTIWREKNHNIQIYFSFIQHKSLKQHTTHRFSYFNVPPKLSSRNPQIIIVSSHCKWISHKPLGSCVFMLDRWVVCDKLIISHLPPFDGKSYSNSQ